MKRGIMISFEGGEGSGKTSVLKALLEKLCRERDDIILTREPGGTKISEDIRSIILNKDNTEMDAKTEALLYCASRRQHLVEVVFPALKAGKIVFSDRYIDSSLVYQGFARGIGIEEVMDINMFAIDQRMPDLTVYFNITPEVGLERIAKNAKREINRLDLERLDFHNLVHEGYLHIARLYPDRIMIIDAEKDFNTVYKAVEELVLKTIAQYE